MAETSVFTGRAVVYYFDSTKKTWAPSPVAGYTRLDIYKNSATGGFRVIGRGMEDPNQVVINSALAKETAYVRTRDQFHQFQDPRYLYGLSFGTPADAESFAAEFEKAVAALKGGPAAPPPAKPAAPAPAPLKVAPVVIPQQPKPAAPTAAPTPPIASPKPPGGGPPPPPAKNPPPPPKAPPKPAATPRSDDHEPPSDDPTRGALLNSIQGFSKNKLKKAETVDKSGPVLAPAKPAASAASSSPAADSSDSAPRATPAKGGAMQGGDMMGAILAKRAAMQKTNTSPSLQTQSAAPAVEPKKPAAVPPIKANTLTRTEAASSTKPAVPPPARPGGPKPPPPRVLTQSDDYSDASAAPSSPHNSNSELPAHLRALKEEILAEVRAELAQMKSEILNAIYNR